MNEIIKTFSAITFENIYECFDELYKSIKRKNLDFKFYVNQSIKSLYNKTAIISILKNGGQADLYESDFCYSAHSIIASEYCKPNQIIFSSTDDIIKSLIVKKD